jgi:hypothetical protein
MIIPCNHFLIQLGKKKKKKNKASKREREGRSGKEGKEGKGEKTKKEKRKSHKRKHLFIFYSSKAANNNTKLDLNRLK